MQSGTSSARRSQATSWLAYAGATALLAALAFVACSDIVTPPQRTTQHAARKASDTECTSVGYVGGYYDGDTETFLFIDAPSIVDPNDGFDYSWDTYADDWEWDDGVGKWRDDVTLTRCYVYADPDPPVDCNLTPWDPSCPPPPPPPPPCESDCGPPGGGSGPHYVAVALTVDSTNVGPGSTITARAIVSTDDGTPYTIIGWTFTGMADSSCTPDLSCALKVESSGSLSFTARRNDDGSLASDSAQITVVYPCSQTETMDARDHIRAEYDSTALFSGQPWKPDCNALLNNVETTHFKHSALYVDVDGHYGYGFFAGSILNGLEVVRSAWLDSTLYTSLSVNSVYRSPRVNANVYLSRGLAYERKQGRHMYGVAADLDNPAKDSTNAHEVWLRLFNLATTFSQGRVLNGTQDRSCSVRCVHLDYNPPQ